MISTEYRDYLNSDAWRAKRIKRLTIAKFRCAACASTHKVEVHHLTYARIFNENMEDLLPLCKYHHAAAEELVSRGDLPRSEDVLFLATETIRLLKAYGTKIKKQRQCVSLPSKQNNGNGVRRINRKHLGIVEVPYSEEDVKIPDGERFVLTRELIDNCRANGSFTYATLNALGITKEKMTHGWIDRLVGTALSRQQYSAAVRAKFRYREKLKRGD